MHVVNDCDLKGTKLIIKYQLVNAVGTIYWAAPSLYTVTEELLTTQLIAVPNFWRKKSGADEFHIYTV